MVLFPPSDSSGPDLPPPIKDLPGEIDFIPPEVPDEIAPETVSTNEIGSIQGWLEAMVNNDINAMDNDVRNTSNLLSAIDRGVAVQSTGMQWLAEAALRSESYLRDIRGSFSTNFSLLLASLSNANSNGGASTNPVGSYVSPAWEEYADTSSVAVVSGMSTAMIGVTNVLLSIVSPSLPTLGSNPNWVFYSGVLPVLGQVDFAINWTDIGSVSIVRVCVLWLMAICCISVTVGLLHATFAR
jgi:hypothetical protein